ncbi:hypothetical protein AVEN_31667-1 [Araneus ventricosus]|uniref:Uncharacterized protein n=1 Tax=Araneus ventricosus TaxID=182803 RepID=A0A4Y2TQE1_ARAVE|nr:hypothetical protein AVEN_31667-1 [Araneus ventricosus]
MQISPLKEPLAKRCYRQDPPSSLVRAQLLIWHNQKLSIMPGLNPLLPTLIIKPANEEIKTSAMLKTALEGKIKLKDIQVEVLSCRPIQGNGIDVKDQNP